MEETLESLGLGGVSVSRNIANAQYGDFSWTITFDGLDANVPLVRLNDELLHGKDLQVAVTRKAQGNEIGGTFRLLFGFSYSEPIAFDVSAEELEFILIDLTGISSVMVDHVGPDKSRGFLWKMTFSAAYHN